MDLKSKINFFNHSTKNITRASFIIAGFVLFSKILGLLRNLVLREVFGIGRELDIYFAAFRIPDFIYNILIIGALSGVFIPIFARYHLRSKKEAFLFSNNVLFVFLFFSILLSIFCFIFTPQILKVMVPGFKGSDFKLAVALTRIMFLSPIFFGISSIIGSILQYFSRFLIYSLAPIMYNLGIIFGAIFFVPSLGLKGLAWGVVFGAILHLLIQIPSAIFCGWRPKFIFNLKDEGLKRIFKLMGPRTLGIAVSQINFIFITAIASLISAGAITIFNFANDLQHLPISLFGISFATAAFPYLSRKAALKDKEKFKKKFHSIFCQILFFLLPLSILFFILRAQLIRVIYGPEIFGSNPLSWAETRLLAASLGLFSFSIFAQGLIPLFARGFFAFEDTKTPVKLSIFSVILNIIFALIFIKILASPNFFYFALKSFLKLEGISEMRILALPLAFSLSSIFNLIFLFWKFNRKLERGLEFKKDFLRIFILSFFIGIFCWSLLRLPFFGKLERFFEVFFQLLFSGTLSIVFYLFFAKIFHFKEFKAIKKAMMIY